VPIREEDALMDLLPSQEQEEIVASIASLLSTEMPVTRMKELVASADPVDRALLAKCGELGWFTLGLSEALGGVGYGLAEEALLFRELGRHLTPGPFMGMVLGARLAALAGLGDVAAAIGAGTKTVGLSLLEGELVVGANAAVSGQVLSVDGSGIDLLLVVTPDWAALFDAAALTFVPDHESLDPMSRLAVVQLDGALPLAKLDESQARLHLRGVVLAAAVLSGLSEGSRDMSAEHARTRVQFGKPIGVNQAIKHSCTDMAVRSEVAVFQTFYAAMTVDKLDHGIDAPDAVFQAASAKVVAQDAAYRNARADVQVHGGMGFTAENESHYYIKRAHVMAELFSDRKQLLAQVLAVAPAQ
jgi:alkylation response protein AidB-like acyl-CoA dehydrogenase